MPIDLAPLKTSSKLLFSVPLQPIQGDRFQPTGFPDLGAATFQTTSGLKLLLESAQSMANRLEAVCWNEVEKQPTDACKGLSYVRVEKNGEYLTSSMTEAHRINSPYILEGKDKAFFDYLKAELAVLSEGPIDRKVLAQALLKHDVGSLLHGVFLAKKELAGGRLRVSRALGAFIEANNVTIAASGGVKNDAINPSGEAKTGFGNVPFHREEYVAESITCYFNLDLAQIRGYGLGEDVENLLITLALYKIRAFLSGNMRLRTACDLALATDAVVADQPSGFQLPDLKELEASLRSRIEETKSKMQVTPVKFTS